MQYFATGIVLLLTLSTACKFFWIIILNCIILYVRVRNYGEGIKMN